MLTLLRVRRVARLQRQPELDGASHPLRRAGSWQPSFFFGAIRDFTNPVAQASNLQTTNLGVGSSNLSGRAILRQGPLPRPSRGSARVTNDSGVVRLARA